MKRALFLIIILVITIKGAIAQGENLVKDGSFENIDRVNSDFNYNQWWGFGNYTITDQVVSKWGKTFVDPIGSNGRFLIVDVGPSKKQRLWYDSITVKPNTTYSFTCIVANVFAPVNNNDMYAPREYTPVMQLNVNGKRVSRAIVLYSMMDDERKTEWKTLSGQFTSGPDQTRIEISIVDKVWGRQGNDVAVDNIYFAEVAAPQTVPPVVKEKEKKEIEEEVPPVVAIITEPEKEVPPVEIPSIIKEEPIKEIPPAVVKEEPIVVPPKQEPPVAILPKPEPKPKPEEKKTIVAPTIEKKFVSPTVTVPKKESDPPPVEVKEKIEISAPEIEKKRIVTPVATIKKDNSPVIVKKEPESKPEPKPEPVKPKVFSSDIKISDVKVNEILELSHIYFEKSKSHLLPASIPELKDLIKFMKENPGVRIRLEGHTESGGDPKKNAVLSENRVKEVKKYLVENGVETGRIELIGHGGTKPLYEGDDEERKKLNRRVEVVVISK